MQLKFTPNSFYSQSRSSIRSSHPNNHTLRCCPHTRVTQQPIQIHLTHVTTWFPNRFPTRPFLISSSPGSKLLRKKEKTTLSFLLRFSKNWRCVKQYRSSYLNWVFVLLCVLLCSAMFDWNDEELTNIIWGEADESGDHIVPYPEASEGYSEKKAWNQENDNIKSIELKAPGAKVDIHDRKLESCSNVNFGEGTSGSGFSLDLWPNLSLASVANTKQDSLDNSVSSNLTGITKFASSGAESAQLSKHAESKEQGDFVDYGWASIGSFDDLDRIFSNDDQIFSNVNLGNADELWPSSKDVTTSPVKSFPISVGSRAEYMQEGDQLFRLGIENMNHPASHVLQNAHSIMNHVEFAGSKSNPVVKEEQTETILEKNTMGNSQLTADNLAVQKGLEDKVNKPKKLLRGRKKPEEKNEVKFYPDPYGNCSSCGSQAVQFKTQFAAPVLQSSPAPFVSQPKHLIGHGQFQNQPISNPLMAASAYGSVTKPYSAMPVLSHIQSGQLKDQELPSSGDENTLNKLAPSPAKTQTMTPQEKIEKLRRRQQIQAMLAIQKQQQQFGHQVSSSDQSVSHKCSQDNQIHQFEGAEDLSNFPSFNPNSPIEQDSNTTSLAVNDYSVEDTIVYLLQDIIAKLDARIRLCIRDSLFRLAKSAMQRHTATDTSRVSNSRDEQFITTNESINHNGNAKVTEVETETNPIDRAVAHLLFYRSPELSGKHPDTPESPASTKLLCEHKTGITENLSMRCVPESPESKQTFGCSLVDQCKNNFYLDNLENASNNGPPGEDDMGVEASQ